MNYSKHIITLDVHDMGSQACLSAKRRDTRRRIYASLTEGGKPYNISEDCRAVFTAKKPDGNVIFNDCVVENNIIRYEITEQTVMEPGQVECEFRLYGEDNGLITSPRFVLLVDSTVYDDDDMVESVTEVSTLTRLISEATALVAEVNAALDNGDFIPKLSIGNVTTLPAGSNATVTITGTGEAPVLNFGIPQGDEGQAEGMIPDAELSEESTRPVQNKVITSALRELEEETGAALSTLETEKVDKKVDKEEGKGLSQNDFTDALLSKLEGIEAGANKYSLPAAGAALGGVKSGGDISVSADGEVSIVSGAVSESFALSLTVEAWVDNSQTLAAAGVTAENTVIVSPEPGAENYAAYTEAAVRCAAQAEGVLTFVCETAPETALTVNVTVINK